MADTIKCGGKDVPHNTQPWETRANRHSNTDGTRWGWIEGAPGNICWSNNSQFNEAAAGRVCKEHNDWLEQQKPIALRIVEARAEVERVEKHHLRVATELARIDILRVAAIGKLSALEFVARKAAS